MNNVIDGWTSWHIFYHNFEKHDQLLLEIKKVMMSFDNRYKWFFIRYWEGGPHIRLRILDASKQDLAILRYSIMKFMEDNNAHYKFSKEQYYKGHKFDGAPVSMDKLPWYENGTIVAQEYVRELQRYGGEDIITLSEDLFMSSSELAIEVVQDTMANLPRRLSKGIEIMLKTIISFGVKKENIAEFFKIYGDSWGRFLNITHQEAKVKLDKEFNEKYSKQLIPIVQDIIQQESFEEEFFHEVTSKKTEVEKIKQENFLKVIESLLYSHIHMTNNRLGLTPVIEYQLSYFIYKSLISIEDIRRAG